MAYQKDEDEEMKVEYDTEPKFDTDKVHDLLSIVDLARDHPNLKPLFDEALRALAGIAAELVQKLAEEAKEREAA